MRRLLPLSAMVLLVSACTGGGITIPSFSIPSFPPIELPSGGGVLPPGAIPSGSVPCTLVTAAEVTQIVGTPVTDTTSEAGDDCVFITNAFATISVGLDDSSDLSGIQFLMGNSAQQTTVGGFPALSGNVLSLPAVYVQKPSGQVHVIGFLSGSDPNMMTKLQQIATIAVGRAP